MKIVVLGGRGFIGALLLDWLRKHGHEAYSLGRSTRNDIAFDLSSHSDFSSVASFDVVINFSDIYCEQLAAFCLREGKLFMECSSDPSVYVRLVNALGRFENPRGMVLLGAGLFPGLLGLLAVECGKDCSRIEAAVEIAPLSGAGGGMVRLMTEQLVQDRMFVQGGELCTGSPIAAGGSFRFGKSRRSVMAGGLSEPFLLHYSRKLQAAATFIATRPPTPNFIVPLLAFVVRVPGVTFLMGLAMKLLRGVVLRKVPASVKLAARAGNGELQKGAYLSVKEGQKATVICILAMLANCEKFGKGKGGLFTPDQVFGFTDVIQTIDELDRDCFAHRPEFYTL